MVKARGHLLTEQAAMKFCYLVTRSLDQGHRSDTMGSAVEASPDAFAITFADRMPAAEDG